MAKPLTTGGGERALRGAAEGDVGLAGAEEHGTQDHRMPAGGTRVGRGGAGAVEPEVLGDLPGRLVNDHRRDEVRADRRTLATGHPGLLGLQQVEPAERRAEHHGRAVGVKPGIRPADPGVGPGGAGRGHPQVEEPRRELGDGRVLGVGAGAEVVHKARQVLEIGIAGHRRMAADSGTPLGQPAPGRVHVAPQAGHRGMPHDEDPIRHPGLLYHVPAARGNAPAS